MTTKLNKFLGTLETISRIVSNTQSITTRNKGDFPFIPLNANYAHTLLKTAKAQFKVKTKLKFIDIGCGIGNILALASYLKMETYGVDCESRYLSKVANMHSLFFNDSKVYMQGYDHSYRYAKNKKFNLDVRLFHDSISQISGALISDMDIIYFYNPTINQQERDALVLLLTNYTKKGCVILCPGWNIQVKGFVQVGNTFDVRIKL